MCGIWCYIGNSSDISGMAHTCVTTLLPRGPESIDVQHLSGAILGFTRLAINGLSPAGMQPMHYGNVHWICNGEIYNWKELRTRFELNCSSDSDCSVIGPLWVKFRDRPTEFFRALDGVFSIVIVDGDNIIVARDPYGVRPLFRRTVSGGIAFGSEMKSLIDLPGTNISSYPPGHWSRYSLSGVCEQEVAYHTIPWLKTMSLSPMYGLEMACTTILKNLTIAVQKRVLTTERPIGALLSGGIDSSLIAAMVQHELRAAGRGPLETFSIGFAGSPDLHYARIVANHIGSKHHEIVVTPADFFKAIPEVIRAIESYDITSVRASVGNWLVCREISRRSHAKVIFNGDGADEIFGSYLYFFRAPDEEAFEAEVSRLLQDIHLYDVLRSDRSISSHGLEARTPFLDKQFVAVARSIATVWRRPIKVSNEPYMERSTPHLPEPQCEKWILRKAFEHTGLLPGEVLWRQKEAFSDGVSSGIKSWYQEIQDRVPVGTLSTKVYTHLPPVSAESRYYRDIFDSLYGKSCEQIFSYFWMPKWSGETTDPSARTLSIYK